MDNNEDRATRYARGRRKVVEVTGDEGENVVDSLGELGRYIVEFAYGDVYSSDVLSLREREIATVAILTAMSGRELQLRIHMQAALNAGVTPRELEELIVHTVLYAGFPTAINAMRILKKLTGENGNNKGNTHANSSTDAGK